MRGDVGESRADAGAPRGGRTHSNRQAAVLGSVRDLASWPAVAARLGYCAAFALSVQGPAPITFAIGRDRYPPVFGSRARLAGACVQRKDNPGTANRRKCRKGSANAGLGRDRLFVSCPDPNLGSSGFV